MKVIPKENLIIRNSMLLPYRGSEFWGIELDSLSIYSDIVTQKFLKDIAYTDKKHTTSIIAIHLNNTLLTPQLMELITENLYICGDNVRRVAFIGIKFFDKLKIQKIIKTRPNKYCYSFFDDYEKAKEWLIPR